MKCRILHESGGRLRIHICQPGMTPEKADILQAYLTAADPVRKATVDERTGNAVVQYREGTRAQVIHLFSVFDFENAQESVMVPEHSSRNLSRHYEDRLFFHIARRGLCRLLPAPVRMLLTGARSLPYFGKAIRSLAGGRMDVPVLDAASIGVSLLRGEWATAASVIFLLGVGDIMEEWTRKKSVEDLAGAMALNVDRVWKRVPGAPDELADVDCILEGEEIIVRTGGMIPLDGIVAEGEGMVNQSSITGEPLPAHKHEGSLIYAGTVVEEGELVIRVRQTAGTGRYDRIVKMIEESEQLKSRAEEAASGLADKLVPWTLGATLLTWIVTRNPARAAAILMVDFCCALKLSMPISVLSAMREAGAHRISVKGGKYLENFSEAETIVFDKTGTLTEATPSVQGVVSFNGCDPREMLRLAACLEEHYPHSMANAVVEAARIHGLEHEERHSRVEYIVAHGIASSINGKKVRIGSSHFIFDDEGAVIPEHELERFKSLPDEYSHLYMCIDGVLAAVILIEDPLKEETPEVIRLLRSHGFSRIVMITGDSERTARAVAGHAGMDAYFSEVLPEEKAEFIRKEHDKGHKVVMIGDGVNDAPALSEADCGVAISSGAAIAREVADITIKDNDLYALVTMKEISDLLMARIRRNYNFILSFNSFLIIMAVLGVFPSGTTALLHNMSTIGISLSSMTDLLPDA